MTLKDNRAPLQSNIKLCASFHHHMWIQTGVTVRKQLRWVLTSVTFTFELWPWPFAWTSLLSLAITPENLMMIRWWEHSEKGVTDGQTDRLTDWSVLRAAWSQLKINLKPCCFVEIVVLPAILFSSKIKVATRKTAIYSTVRVHFRKFRWQSNVFCITWMSIESLERDVAVISRICGRILNRFASWV